MKKGLLGSTALVGAAVLMAGAASAAEAPTWKLGGNMNFQAYLVDQDLNGTTKQTIAGNAGIAQDHGYYFGVDESELKLNVSGSTDNGLDYGFKIELNANQAETSNADEVRLSLGGSWGTLQLGDEDGAEDTMNYGGENLMGATGGFDGDQDDWYENVSGATSFPEHVGDTGDQTKITYYSPRFSGLQVGVSIAPTENEGDNKPMRDAGVGGFEDAYGLGGNYDGEFSGVRVRASAVYAMASAIDNPVAANQEADIGAFQVGGIVNFGQFAVGANYGDNGDTGNDITPDESAFWNVAASFSQGPLGVAVGYMASTFTAGGVGNLEEEYTHLAFTADYSLAPGLSVYGEVALISSEDPNAGVPNTNDGTGIILGANVSF